MSKFATKHEETLATFVFGIFIFLIFAVIGTLYICAPLMRTPDVPVERFYIIGASVMLFGAVAGWVFFRGIVGNDYTAFKRDALALIRQGK
jgi:hypothetical protein